jgi:hypothetical protein
MHTCFGLEWLGLCNYDPAAPAAIYFSPGAAIGALAFTVAVQQLLRPIYRLRLRARYLSVSHLYIFVFSAVAATLVAAVVPSFPALHGGPWGYAIVWELLAAILFVIAYGAVAVAVAWPVRVHPKRIDDFARGVARLLSAANETDHTDLVADLRRSLPILLKEASFVEHLRETTAFFDFIHRKKIEQASYASSLLRIIADPPLCAALVTRAPWIVGSMLKDISVEHLHAASGEQFIRELARQAILRDDGLMAREIGYHGFGTAPLLSESLFSDAFILISYNPFGSLFGLSGDPSLGSLLTRFNNAAERCYNTLIEHRHTDHATAAFNIQGFYRSIFMSAYKFQKAPDYDYRLVFEMQQAVTDAIKIANKLLASLTDQGYQYLFVSNAALYRSDVLETLVEIVYEALASISNQFKGVDDPFWILAIDVMHKAFNFTGQQPDGMTPFQQRLALKIIEKLNENMRGFYPAICKVLLSTIGPYHHASEQPNRTAFNIFKDAMYIILRLFPNLAQKKPDKFTDYLPPNVAFDASTNQLTHTFRNGAQIVTALSSLQLKAFSLTSPRIRRALTDEERQAAERTL